MFGVRYAAESWGYCSCSRSVCSLLGRKWKKKGWYSHRSTCCIATGCYSQQTDLWKHREHVRLGAWRCSADSCTQWQLPTLYTARLNYSDTWISMTCQLILMITSADLSRRRVLLELFCWLPFLQTGQRSGLVTTSIFTHLKCNCSEVLVYVFHICVLSIRLRAGEERERRRDREKETETERGLPVSGGPRAPVWWH